MSTDDEYELWLKKRLREEAETYQNRIKPLIRELAKLETLKPLAPISVSLDQLETRMPSWLLTKIEVMPLDGDVQDCVLHIVRKSDGQASF
jgi:hypothetical protein